MTMRSAGAGVRVEDAAGEDAAGAAILAVEDL
jgi:hypothetical protein